MQLFGHTPKERNEIRRHLIDPLLAAQVPVIDKRERKAFGRPLRVHDQIVRGQDDILALRFDEEPRARQATQPKRSEGVSNRKSTCAQGTSVSDGTARIASIKKSNGMSW